MNQKMFQWIMQSKLLEGVLILIVAISLKLV